MTKILLISAALGATILLFPNSNKKRQPSFLSGRRREEALSVDNYEDMT
ncbi:MAG: hypothetical protein IMF07_05335 [Proteobacteria bacterium]|nr:hypothetical protein [Pseudomonadota bacterium]